MTARLKTLERAVGTTQESSDADDFRYNPQFGDKETYWPDGTDSGEIEEIWADTRTLSASTSDTLELDNLSIVAGNITKSVAFTKVKYIRIENRGSGSALLTVGGGTGGAGAADAWAGAGTPFPTDGDLIAIQAGGVFVWQNPAGGDVTNSTADVLELAATGAEVTYDIFIAGNVS